jgi:hypothetical protein
VHKIKINKEIFANNLKINFLFKYENCIFILLAHW